MSINDTNIETFFSGLSATMDSIREVRKIYDPIMAFEFNSLNFWGPGENKTSDILAFFLDPKQTHGQRDIFLQLFLKKFGLDEKVPKNAKVDVTCEFTIEENRRIDIYITFNKNEYVIAIENKIWARDQNQQLTDCNSHLEKKIIDKYTLFYLNPYGLFPSEESISEEELNDLEKKEKIKVISYQDDIINLVHEWSIHCQAVRVRSFLQDFKQYLKQEITGERIMNEYENIVKYILKNPEYIEIVFAVNNSMGDIKSIFLNKLKEQVEEIAKELSEDLSEDLSFNPPGNWEDGFGTKKDKSFYLQVNNWKSYRIGFSFEKSWANDFCYGICIKDKIPDFEKEIKKLLIDKLGDPSNSTERWPWYKFFDHPLRDWCNYYIPWTKIVEGEDLKNEIKSKAIDILEKLEGVEL